MTISTGLPSDGGESKHHRFMPSGSPRWGMFTAGFVGAYVQLLIRPVESPIGRSPLRSTSAMLVLDQVKRDVESVAPPSENV
jgi:hypothetical protein